MGDMKKTNSASKTRKSLGETKMCEESGDKTGVSTKLKAKREPLPMKMRAFPKSFWQEPNASGIVLPTTCCSPLEDERDQNCHSQVLGKANTDLLFSLFQNVNQENEKKIVPVVKRGRPRKPKPMSHGKRATKDEDPYFTSAIVPVMQSIENDKIAQEQQVMALISVPGGNEAISLSSCYSERLSDLVVNL